MRAGIQDIIIITGRHKRTIEDHFDRSFELRAYCGMATAGTTWRASAEAQQPGQSALHPAEGAAGLGTRLRSQGLPGSAQPGQSALHPARGLGDAVYHAGTMSVTNRSRSCLGTPYTSPVPVVRQLSMDVHCTGGSVIAAERVPGGEGQGLRGLGRGQGVRPAVRDKGPGGEAPAGGGPLGPVHRRNPVLTPGIFECLERTEPGYNGECSSDALRLLREREARWPGSSPERGTSGTSLAG